MAIKSWAKNKAGVAELEGKFGLCPKGDREHTMFGSDDKSELDAKAADLNGTAKSMGLKTVYEVYER